MEAPGPVAVVKLLLAAGWVAHALSWSRAAARVGRQAARPGEWPWEGSLRAAIVAIVAAALLVPTGSRAPSHPLAVALLLILFISGQLLAVRARRELGDHWGIGTAPRVSGTVVHSGPYRLVKHPIYLGTSLALLAQFLMLQNLPSFMLLAGAVIVIPFKIRVENRALGRAP